MSFLLLFFIVIIITIIIVIIIIIIIVIIVIIILILVCRHRASRPGSSHWMLWRPSGTPVLDGPPFLTLVLSRKFVDCLSLLSTLFLLE